MASQGPSPGSAPEGAPESATELWSERGSPLAQRIGGAVGILLFLALLLAPGLPLDAVQRKVAAVTALTAALWISVALPIGATSLIPAALFPVLGVIPARAVAPLYLPDLVFLFLGAFVLALGLERFGVHKRMALAILSRFGGSPRRLVLGFMAATAFLSLWINNTAATLLMLPIATATLARTSAGLAERARRDYAAALMLGVAYASSIGGMGTLTGTAPNQVFVGQFAARFAAGPRISFGEWFVAWMPLVLVFVPIAWLLLTRVVFPLPPGADGRSGAGAAAVFRAERAAAGPWSSGERRMAVLFAITAFAWVFRADLSIGGLTVPGWTRLVHGARANDPDWLAAHRDDIGDATVALVVALVMFVVPAGGGARGEKGERTMLMDWRTANALPWDVLLLLGAGFCIAHGFKVSALDAVLGELLAPLLAGHSTWLVVAGVVLFMCLLTEVTSNTATTAVLLPVVAAAGLEAGIDPRLVMLPATLAASAAFMLPVATPPNAVVFASRRVSSPAMARAGAWLNVASVVVITLVFQLWVRRVLDIAGPPPEWAR